MLKLSVFILFAFYLHASCIVQDLDDAGKLVWNLYSILETISLSDNNNLERLSDMFIDGNVADQEIKAQMAELFKKLDEIDKVMYPKNITDSLKLLLTKAIKRARVTQLELSIQNIDSSYELFREHLNREEDNTDDKFEELVGKISGDIEGDITLIRKLVIGEISSILNHRSVVDDIADDAVFLRDELCDNPQLITIVLAQLLRMVVIAEMKTNFMLLIAHTHQYREHAGLNKMVSFSATLFKKHFTSYVNVFAPNLARTESVYLRTCDPANGIWIRDEQFYEVEETIQTTIILYNGEQCKDTSCKDKWTTNLQQCIPKDHNQRTRCSYTIANCSDIGAIDTCVLRNGPYKFQYMKSTKLGKLGRNFECSGDNGDVFKYGSACACDCYGDDNKISLSIIESRMESNWVITGLRFFRHNKTLYIQPREGKLEANGYISPNNQRWIPIPEDPEVQRIDRERRTFFLDDLYLPSYHALIGVKFNEVSRGNRKGFAIQIFGIPFKYDIGECLPHRNHQVPVKAPNTDAGTGIEFPRVPSTYASVHHTPNSEDFGYVSLEKSELSADFGQSTVPFFDAVPIVTNPPSVLGGVGIFHKGADDYAGFISLRLFGIKYSSYLLELQRNAIKHGNVFWTPPEHN